MANSVDLDEVAYYEPPHLDLRCLLIGQLRLRVLQLNNQIHLYFLLKKMREAFAMQCKSFSQFLSTKNTGKIERSFSHFFQQKIVAYFRY